MQRTYIRLVSILLLFTLVGQAAASVTMSCEMPHMEQTQATEHGDVNMHHAPIMMAMDCCDDTSTPTKQECSCPVNACSAYSMLNMNALFTVSLILPEKVTMPLSHTQYPPISLLYRPPMAG